MNHLLFCFLSAHLAVAPFEVFLVALRILEDSSSPVHTLTLELTHKPTLFSHIHSPLVTLYLSLSQPGVCWSCHTPSPHGWSHTSFTHIHSPSLPTHSIQTFTDTLNPQQDTVQGDTLTHTLNFHTELSLQLTPPPHSLSHVHSTKHTFFTYSHTTQRHTSMDAYIHESSTTVTTPYITPTDNISCLNTHTNVCTQTCVHRHMPIHGCLLKQLSGQQMSASLSFIYRNILLHFSFYYDVYWSVSLYWHLWNIRKHLLKKKQSQ